MNFNEWLTVTYPEIVLLPWQKEWVQAQENQEGHRAMHAVVSQVSSGKTFIWDLWCEYKKS